MATSTLRASSLISLLTCVALSACFAPGAEESLAAAKQSLSGNDRAAAVIGLKNALQVQPDLAEARFLLGKSLLEGREAVGATVELRKALDLKWDADTVVPVLARALAAAGENQQVLELDLSRIRRPDAVAEIRLQQALVLARQGQVDKAEQALSAALQLKPDHSGALVMRARLLANRREFAAALPILDQSLKARPDDADALAAKADILRIGLGRPSEAESLYRKALTSDPGHGASHTALIDDMLGRKEFDAAKAQIEAMQAASPSDPQVTIFQARLALLQGNLKTAADLILGLLKIGPDDPQVLLLAGALALTQHDMSAAARHLGRLVQLMPRGTEPRLMLATAQLAMGSAGKALATLDPLISQTPADPKALALAGSAHLVSGDFLKAEQAFANAAKSRPDDLTIRTRQAAMRLARGDPQRGLADLDAIAERDLGTTADLTLINEQLRRRDFDASIRAIDRLATKLPGKALPDYLRGQAQLVKGALAPARAAFDRALQADPGYFAATDALAALDIRDGRMDAARQRFEAAATADPKNGRALLGLALVDERTGKPDAEVVSALSRAVAASPADLHLRRQLVQFHLSRQNAKAALAAAQEAASSAPSDPSALQQLADIQRLLGDFQQASVTIAKAVRLQPSSIEPLLALVEAQIAAQRLPDAEASLRKATALRPDSWRVVQAAVRLDLARKDPGSALTRIRALQVKQPKQAAGWSLEGDIRADRGEWMAAAGAYRTALLKGAPAEVALRLHMSLRSSGDAKQAETFAGTWIAGHPRDTAFLFHLATIAIADKKLAEAANLLERHLKLLPDDAAALNNLAWVQATLKMPGAVALAQRASTLQPANPAFLDTLALALAAEGKLKAAIEAQQGAVDRAPGTASLRLSLARLYLQSGNKSAARPLLNELAGMGGRFDQQGEVRDLQAKL